MPMNIYLVVNKINGKKYVGQTIQTYRHRWTDHLAESKRGKGYLLGSAIRKYGASNFDVTVIGKAESKEQLDALEISLIQEHNALYPQGYNLELGGSAPMHSAETRAKMSRALKGKKRTDQHKRNYSLASTGRIFSEEAKANMRKAWIHRKSRPLPELTRLRLRRAYDWKKEVFRRWKTSGQLVPA